MYCKCHEVCYVQVAFGLRSPDLQVRERPKKANKQSDWRTFPMRKDWEGWDGSPWRSSSSGQTSLMYKNIQMGGAKRMNPGSRVVATMRVAKSVERNTEDSLWKSGNTYFLWGWHEQVSQEDCEFFIQTFKGYLDTDLASLLWVTLLEWGSYTRLPLDMPPTSIIFSLKSSVLKAEFEHWKYFLRSHIGNEAKVKWWTLFNLLRMGVAQ